ncbi:hypothetical protein ACR9PT_07815 [Piscirickettsia salmonis]
MKKKLILVGHVVLFSPLFFATCSAFSNSLIKPSHPLRAMECKARGE